MHIHVTKFLLFHILFSISTALPSLWRTSTSKPSHPAVRGSAQYITKWMPPPGKSCISPMDYTITRTSPPEIWPGEVVKFQNNKLVQKAALIKEAVKKCIKGECKYHGEGRHGIAWLVTLSDSRQHILKVMFGPDTRNRFTVRRTASGDGKPMTEHTTQADDFANFVYMANRVNQLDAFGILENHSSVSHPIAFYILMPYLGLSFRLAFNTHRNEFTNKHGVFVWEEELQKVLSAYKLAYRVDHADPFLNNFVFNPEPWEARLVDWSGSKDLVFDETALPTYRKIAKLVVKVEDPKEGYYNDETNNNHDKTEEEESIFFERLQSFAKGQQPIPLDFK